MHGNIILTGASRSGKSTLLSEVVPYIPNAVGILTREVRENGQRVGFEAVTSSGSTALIAHINCSKRSALRFGQYYLYLQELEALLKELGRPKPGSPLYIDEIGDIQAYSVAFQSFANMYLHSTNPCLASVSSTSSKQFIKNVLSTYGTGSNLVTITPDTRLQAKERVLELVGRFSAVGA